MEANYLQTCLPVTLHEEGGKANNKKDPGGRTNEGITQKTFDAYQRSIGQPTEDVFDITPAQVAAIYHRDFWVKTFGPDLASGPDLAAFDCGVMSGPGRALSIIKAYGGTKKVNASPVQAAMYICDARLGYVQSLKSLFVTFGKGWAARIGRIRAKSIIMATHSLEGRSAVAPPSTAAKVALTKAADASLKKSKQAVVVATAPSVAAGASAATAGVVDVPGWALGSGLGVCLAVGAFVMWRSHIHAAVAKAATDAITA